MVKVTLSCEDYLIKAYWNDSDDGLEHEFQASLQPSLGHWEDDVDLALDNLSQDDIDKGNFIFAGLSCKEDGSYKFKFYREGDNEKFFVITGSGMGSFDIDVNRIFGEGVFTS